MARREAGGERRARGAAAGAATADARPTSAATGRARPEPEPRPRRSRRGRANAGAAARAANRGSGGPGARAAIAREGGVTTRVELNQRAFGHLYAIEQALDRRSLPTGRRRASPRCPPPWRWKESPEHAEGDYYCANEKTGERRWQAPSESKPKRSDDKITVVHVLIKHADSRRPASHRTPKISLAKSDARNEADALRKRVAASSDMESALADGQCKTFGRRRRTAPHQPMGGGSSPSSAGI